MSHPPIDRVLPCRSCAHLFRAVVSWRDGSPAYRRVPCPWCGVTQLVGRDA